MWHFLPRKHHRVNFPGEDENDDDEEEEDEEATDDSIDRRGGGGEVESFPANQGSGCDLRSRTARVVSPAQTLLLPPMKLAPIFFECPKLCRRVEAGGEGGEMAQFLRHQRALAALGRRELTVNSSSSVVTS